MGTTRIMRSFMVYKGLEEIGLGDGDGDKKAVAKVSYSIWIMY